jgi:hypothetical protein
MIDDLMIEFRKGMQQMVRERIIKECFHPSKSECVLPIKQAHSLQRNRRLSLIEEPVNGQNCIYTVTSFSSDRNIHLKEFIPVGKKEASTFYGFCSKHDTDVFSPIENFEFDGSDKHLFLHSYRSFAHSYHQKKQELQLYKSNWETMKKLQKEYKEQMIAGAELGLKDLQPEKDYLDDLLIHEQYDNLEYSLFETNEFYPFGCSSLITPHYSVKNTPLEDDIYSTELPWTSLIFTVVPDKTNSFIIVASNPNNKKALTFLNDLDDLNDEKYLLAISSLITTLAENTFWSPKLWDAMSSNAKNVMKNNARYIFDSSKPKGFPWSSLNLFQPNFTAEKLGINKG